MPDGLSNVVSIIAEGGYWAIKRDGTLTGWGNGTEAFTNKVASLRDVTAVAWSGDRKYQALKSDGTVLGFRFETPYQSGFPISPDTDKILPVRVHGVILSNVVALASMPGTTVVLKNDGTVLILAVGQTTGIEWSEPPCRYDSAAPVMVNGQALSNVVAIASGGGHCLALKSDGTVIAFGNNDYGQTAVPAGLSNVIAIAAAPNNSLALKRDGTVAAWGDNRNGQTSVPAGLSNVVAIASGGNFSLAVITGSPPSSVFIQPHGWIEEMTAEADLVFKGQVLSSDRITNSAFGISFLRLNSTKFKLISVLKGNITTNEIIFQHYSGWNGRGGDWGGPPPPASYKFETGQSYLVFASKMDKPDRFYTVLRDNTNNPDEFRQPMTGSFAIHTLDARPLNNLSIKEAVSFEQKLILDNNPTNQIPVQK